ncbi:hypothetical protein, partial [Desulfovibrio sp.]|uniref:hypothetical protein n=1 Tax=Desulfovibrio sp. TaxID=885 RepID=UPI003FD7456B
MVCDKVYMEGDAMAEFEVDFRDLSLFGNSASEDEDSDIFESYALRRDEVDTFISNNKIC